MTRNAGNDICSRIRENSDVWHSTSDQHANFGKGQWLVIPHLRPSGWLLALAKIDVFVEMELVRVCHAHNAGKSAAVL